jgi:hypothetical protein
MNIYFLLITNNVLRTVFRFAQKACGRKSIGASVFLIQKIEDFWDVSPRSLHFFEPQRYKGHKVYF